MSIGARIRQLRLSNQLTYANVVERIGCSSGYLSDIEHGRVEPNLHTIRKLATLFDMTPSELLGDAAAGLSVEEWALIEAYRGKDMAQCLRLVLHHMDKRLPVLVEDIRKRRKA